VSLGLLTSAVHAIGAGLQTRDGVGEESNSPSGETGFLRVNLVPVFWWIGARRKRKPCFRYFRSFFLRRTPVSRGWGKENSFGVWFPVDAAAKTLSASGILFLRVSKPIFGQVSENYEFFKS
jgi:hypothetical protein